MSKAGRTVGHSVLIKAGVPMVALMLGGSWALSQFMQTHMDIKDQRNQSVSKRKFDLEEEHRMLMKKLGDTENFTLSRIPRPEENSPDSSDPTKSKKQISSK